MEMYINEIAGEKNALQNVSSRFVKLATTFSCLTLLVYCTLLSRSNVTKMKTTLKLNWVFNKNNCKSRAVQ